MKKKGWHARDVAGTKISHYVKMHGSGELYTSALCGANAGQEGWGSTAGTRQCRRCLAKLKKTEEGLYERNIEATRKREREIYGEVPGAAKAFDMQVQYSQVIGETIPLTWIPVLDVKVVIDLLKRGMDSESCKVSRGVTSAVIKELQVYINEAEERCSRPDTVTTWSHEGEKED